MTQLSLFKKEEGTGKESTEGRGKERKTRRVKGLVGVMRNVSGCYLY